jgi:hypothetical protein
VVVADFGFLDFVLFEDFDDPFPTLKKDAGTAFFRTLPARSDAALE